MNEKLDTHFYNFLAEGNIICGLKAETSEEAIRELVQRLVRNNAGLNADRILEFVMEREKVMPTVIAPGMATPHARLNDLPNMLIALGTTTKGIDFNCPGKPPVNLIILMLTPMDDPGLHLQVLAGLSKDFARSESIRMVAAMESPQDIINYITEAQVSIVDYLRACDVMNSMPVTLLESDTLQKAIDTFAVHPIFDIPVLDDEGDLCGVISPEDILKFSLPDHLLWMNDLTPIRRFQPFAEMLRNNSQTKLADLMRSDYVTVDEETPAIQIAKMFIVKKLRQIIVLRKGKPVGVVNLKNFVTKFFWA